MGKLEISLVESERDLAELHELEEADSRYHSRESHRLFGIGRVDGVSVGYWTGLLIEELFSSTKIYVDEGFRGNGYGNDLKEHQLSFAKAIGCTIAKATVLGNNVQSLKIQEKFGGKFVGKYGVTSKFVFDLTKLNFRHYDF